MMENPGANAANRRRRCWSHALFVAAAWADAAAFRDHRPAADRACGQGVRGHPLVLGHPEEAPECIFGQVCARSAAPAAAAAPKPGCELTHCVAQAGCRYRKAATASRRRGAAEDAGPRRSSKRSTWHAQRFNLNHIQRTTIVPHWHRCDAFLGRRRTRAITSGSRLLHVSRSCVLSCHSSSALAFWPTNCSIAP